MAIEKLTEFAKTGQKNTDDLDLETGFIVNRKPARQWFNWLFSTLTTKINEIIEIIDADFIPKSDVVDNLTTNDATKPISAKQAKLLQDNKLDKTANAVSATKLQTARTIGGVLFDGSVNINLPGVNTAGNQNTSGNAATATKLATARNIGGVAFDGTTSINLPGVNVAGNQNTSGNAASATNCSRSIVAGDGLSGGGELNANRTITLGTPSTITASTSNSTTGTSHTHNLDVNSLPLLGYGQSWIDVTSQRALGPGNVYTNNTSKPILIVISLRGWLSVSVDDVIVSITGQGSDNNRYVSVTVIIPAGSRYSVPTYFMSDNTLKWAELR